MTTDVPTFCMAVFYSCAIDFSYNIDFWFCFARSSAQWTDFSPRCCRSHFTCSNSNVASREQTWPKSECESVLWVYVMAGCIFIEPNQCISRSVILSKSSCEWWCSGWSVGYMWMLWIFDHMWSTLMAQGLRVTGLFTTVTWGSYNWLCGQ